jgi:hypothetical protein
MYEPLDLARFALSEFRRGLEGLTEPEAQTRLPKADGTQMNAISWTVAHIAGHWLHRPAKLTRFAFGSPDPTPPTLAEALGWLEEGRVFMESWLPRADEALMVRMPEGTGGENVGTSLIRAVLHTWFHTGEINAVRQMLGHREIPYVGQVLGAMEWKPAGT